MLPFPPPLVLWVEAKHLYIVLLNLLVHRRHLQFLKGYHLVHQAVQVMQNKAARCITKLGWFTPTRSLLLQCNWLSIKQLTFFHTALQVWKVKQYKCPVYINSKYQPSNTRSSTQGTLLVPVVEKSTSSKSFMIRSAATWNTLPPTIRNIMKLNTFKKRLKEWTRENIDIEWKWSYE